VVEVELPGWSAATEAVGLILIAEAWSVHRQLWEQRGPELSPEVAQRLEMGSLIAAEEVAAAWERARTWAEELARVFATVDLLALPVLAAAPPPLEKAADVSAIRLTAPFNLAGVPALAMPVGRSDEPDSSRRGRVPASLQLVGPRHADEMILSTALALEAAGRPGSPS
jgi:Asp-tRNA(Asn)/Glu-tRNA(Gln) amidotransferase A subunit family amidase